MIAKVLTALEFVSALVIFTIMGVTVVDVVGRYVFNAPLPGSFELTQLLMVLVIFSALPAVSRAGSHITVDVILNMLPKARRKWPMAICGVAVAVMLAFLSVVMWNRAGEVWAIGDSTTYLRIPIGPFAYYIAIACAVAVIGQAAAVVALLRSTEVGSDS